MNDHNNQTIEGYNKTVAKYIETSPQGVSPELQPWIAKNLSLLASGAKILEIGSGSGKDAKYFASKGYDMELTDASQGFVDYLHSAGMKARLLNVLTDDLGGSHDMIFADAVFLHFTPDQLQNVLGKIYKVLNSKGRIVFSLKEGQGDEITDRKLQVPRYFCYWNAADITKALKAAGFENIEVETVDDHRGKARHGWLLVDAEKTA